MRGRHLVPKVIRRMPQAVMVLALARVLLALAGELWLSYFPRYLDALGASAVAIGVWGTLLSGFKAGWQYPGGWLADRWGERKTMLALTAVSLAGLALFLTPYWWLVLSGAAFWTASSGHSVSVTHKVVGSELGEDRRATGFGVVSLMKKPTRIVGPPVGGALITLGFGLVFGIRLAFLLGGVLLVAALALQWRYYPRAQEQAREEARTQSEGRQSGGEKASGVRDMPSPMRRLLVADTLARISDLLVFPFAVLYVVQVLGRSDFTFGLLVGFAASIAMALYLPAARTSDAQARRKPWFVATLAFFALYPATLYLAGQVRDELVLPALGLAFAFKGLQEVGEPARKAYVTELSQARARGRVAGTYYTIRSALSIPAGIGGGFLYAASPALLFAVGAGVAALALAAFLVLAHPWERARREGRGGSGGERDA